MPDLAPPCVRGSSADMSQDIRAPRPVTVAVEKEKEKRTKDFLSPHDHVSQGARALRAGSGGGE